jgi:integrase
MTRVPTVRSADVARVVKALKANGRGVARKSRGRKTQTIPLLGETAELLKEIKSHQAAVLAARTRKFETGQRGRHRPPPPTPVTVLTSSRGLPWSAAGLEGGIIDVKSALQIDKHLHDARGTFGTRLRKAGLSASEIADVLGWDEKRVERLLATYVDRDSIVLEIAERIRRSET